MGELIKTEQQLVEKVQKISTKQIVDLNSQVGELKSKMVEMDNGVSSTALLHGWKYYGRGAEGSSDDSVYKASTTLPQCVEFCEEKRGSGGAEWNGMAWVPSSGWCWCHMNDRGHNAAYTRWMHFKTQ